MRHVSRVIWSTAAVLTLVGCGSQGAPSGSTTTDSTNTQSTTGSPTPSASAPPTTQSPSSIFPVTLMRTGGIAGFRDVVVVTADGLVSVTSKGKAKPGCKLTAEGLGALTTTAAQVAWSRITPTSTEAAFPDDMVMTVTSPVGGPVRLEDSQIGALGKVFQNVFDDVIGGGSAELCPPI